MPDEAHISPRHAVPTPAEARSPDARRDTPPDARRGRPSRRPPRHASRRPFIRAGRESIYPEVPRTKHLAGPGTFVDSWHAARYFDPVKRQNASFHWPKDAWRAATEKAYEARLGMLLAYLSARGLLDGRRGATSQARGARRGPGGARGEDGPDGPAPPGPVVRAAPQRARGAAAALRLRLRAPGPLARAAAGQPPRPARAPARQASGAPGRRRGAGLLAPEAAGPRARLEADLSPADLEGPRAGVRNLVLSWSYGV